MCAGGNITRIATKINVGNSSTYPAVGELPISVRGLLPPAGGLRFYQAFYRNAAAGFCPPGTANYTNGLLVAWTP